jgi:hypothetical protein
MEFVGRQCGVPDLGVAEVAETLGPWGQVQECNVYCIFPGVAWQEVLTIGEELVMGRFIDLGSGIDWWRWKGTGEHGVVLRGQAVERYVEQVKPYINRRCAVLMSCDESVRLALRCYGVNYTVLMPAGEYKQAWIQGVRERERELERGRFRMPGLANHLEVEFDAYYSSCMVESTHTLQFVSSALGVWYWAMEWAGLLRERGGEQEGEWTESDDESMAGDIQRRYAVWGEGV